MRRGALAWALPQLGVLWLALELDVHAVMMELSVLLAGGLVALSLCCPWRCLRLLCGIFASPACHVFAVAISIEALHVGMCLTHTQLPMWSPGLTHVHQ